jgi:hypothetical protein
MREKYCWLVAGGWFVLREKYCWLVADKPNEQGNHVEPATTRVCLPFHLLLDTSGKAREYRKGKHDT